MTLGGKIVLHHFDHTARLFGTFLSSRAEPIDSHWSDEFSSGAFDSDIDA